ncbi:hypothetical protein CDD82_487 [Ophiocordyceps australis]|uniref:Glycosylphosphatidylinositol anchor biosynthesis protein 11 n=1 Tax=Ophiocordyceps australis TaxID=1399860 RepID=A0A2C5YTW7_9HYPO|nr:hypothetical protein CDD82_487 [Ophiocordyceps australis]
MSSAIAEPATSTCTTTTQIKAKAPDAGVSAVPVLDTLQAQVMSLGRRAVLLGLLVTRFRWLVEDPLRALELALPVVGCVQIAYALVCLPAAGSQQGKKLRPGEKKRRSYSGPNPVSTAILSLVLAVMATPVIHMLFVLFGAPLLDHVGLTALCAAHFALLGAFPVFYARGVDSQALIAIAGAAAPLDETFGALVGAVVGAWLGAVPIPLDWDRDWQRWPVTIVVGMYTGSVVCSWACGALFYGKRLGGGAATG